MRPISPKSPHSRVMQFASLRRVSERSDLRFWIVEGSKTGEWVEIDPKERERCG
jgi:hypothetical protein